jgi:hypothetical protein
LRGRFGNRVLSEVIPHDASIGEALSAGRIGCQVHPDSPAAQQFHQLVAKLDLAEGSSPSIALEAILQALREASELAGTANPADGDSPPQPEESNHEQPTFQSLNETAKPAGPIHRPRRKARSGEKPRLARPERAASAAAATPRRWPAGAVIGSPHVSDAVLHTSEQSRSSHHHAQGLVHLWPLWILLGAVIGGGLRLLPHSPSLVPLLNGLAAALLVIVVLATLARQKRAASSGSSAKGGWLRSLRTTKSSQRLETQENFLSLRLSSLASNSKRNNSAADTN